MWSFHVRGEACRYTSAVLPSRYRHSPCCSWLGLHLLGLLVFPLVQYTSDLRYDVQNYKHAFEVSGLENGEDSQQLFSFSKESSSWNANFCLSAWDIRDTGSQGESSLFLLWMGLPPGDLKKWNNLKLCVLSSLLKSFPGGTRGKEPACLCRRCKRQVRSLGQEDSLGRAWQPTPIEFWRIFWTEEASWTQLKQLRT